MGLSRVAYKRIEVVWICALGDEVVVEVPAERCGDASAILARRSAGRQAKASVRQVSTWLPARGACSTEDIVKREQGFPPSEIGLVWVPGIGQNR